MSSYLPAVVVGRVYEDRWASPYIRANFDLPAGEFHLHVQLWNPNASVFEGNLIVIRHKLNVIAETPALNAGMKFVHTSPLTLTEPGLIAISLRSTVSYEPPKPDIRTLGFVLLEMQVEATELPNASSKSGEQGGT
jgi:hypothetical protein